MSGKGKRRKLRRGLGGLFAVVMMLMLFSGLAGQAADDDVASVTIGSETTYYMDFGVAWNAAKAAKGQSATVTVLQSVDMETVTVNPDLEVDDWKHILYVDEDEDITLEMKAGVRIYGMEGNQLFSINGGKLTLKGGEISAGEGYSGGAYAVIVHSGVFNVTDNAVIRGTIDGFINVYGGSVNFSDCTFKNGKTGEYAVSAVNCGSDQTIGDLLANGYAYRYVEPDGSDGAWVNDLDVKSISIPADGSSIKVTESPMRFSKNPEDQSVTYGAAMPELSAETEITRPDAFNGTEVTTYQWYQVIEAGAQKIDGATEAAYTPPAGADAGEYQYYCRAKHGWFSLNSKPATVTVTKKEVTPLIEGTGTKVYDGTTKAPDGLSVVLTGVLNEDAGAVAVAQDKVSYAYNSANVRDADTITASGITLEGSKKGNYKLSDDSAAMKGTITKAQAAISIRSAYTPNKTYDGKAVENPTENELEMIGAGYDDVVFTWKTQDGKPLDGPPVHAGTYQLIAEALKSGNYEAAEAAKTVVIGRAPGVLTVPEVSIQKKFGDKEFSLNCEADGEISYESVYEYVAVVSADGVVRITGTGTTVIVASLAESRDYGAAGRTITVKVAKGDAPDLDPETRNYAHTVGSNGSVTVDTAERLPEDRGETKYAFTVDDPHGILSGVSVGEDGILTYTVKENQNAGSKAVIAVSAEMKNYETAVFTINIEIEEKKDTGLQTGNSGSIKDNRPLGNGTEKPPTGEKWTPWQLMAAVSLAVLIVNGVCFVAGKKKRG